MILKEISLLQVEALLAPKTNTSSNLEKGFCPSEQWEIGKNGTLKALAAAAEKNVTQKSCWYTLVLPPRAYLSRCPNDAQDFFDDAQHDAHIFDDAQEPLKGG